MILSTIELSDALARLPVTTSVIAVDEDDNEYVIDLIKKVKTFSDDEKEWRYALQIRKVNGCIKR